ncbi:BatA domain-containing protein [Mucilaginibacter sp. 21P]|uniref:BatA domain-containing protein n=1 Tax=Mucilaginibacter sp. 21P TaxID=2778902 RepID=UPI001C56E51D|nr:BatA domain-containing protein [Mucilaginibacter sp. 21P]QXV63934.1 BatA domain-containing protein [Mucilaginibacter sp. 21P]
MRFLYPAFLFALLSLVIPVAIHLFNFRRYKKVYFSNVQFLKEVQLQQASRRNLRERLILASRLLALLFLVFAFARPYFPGRDAALVGKQQAISIFVDNSYSMQAINREGSLLDQAKQRAKQIAAAYSINDRFQIITQDFEGKHQRLLSRSEFNDAADAVKPSAQSRTFAQVVAKQQGLLNLYGSDAKRIFIVSDFQKNMAEADKQITSNIPVDLVELKPTSMPNVAVDTAWLLSATHRPGEGEKMVVRLHNYADKAAEKVPLKLTVNGIQKAIGSFTIKARSSQTDTLSFSGLQKGWQRGEIELQDNPITFDNQFYFSFKVSDELRILLINGGMPNKYLTAVFGSDSFFKLTQVGDGNVDYAQLSSYPLVVLSDIKSISAGLVQQLQNYVRKGGSLIVFPSADADINSYRSLLQPIGASYTDKLVNEPTKVVSIDLQSAVFKSIFEALPQNPDLPKVSKYYQLVAGAKRAEHLMKLQTGTDLLAQTTVSKGKVTVAAVPLSEDFSSLPVHALFVPVMLHAALLSGHDMPLFYTIGSNEVMETVPLQSTEKSLLRLVKGRDIIIPDVRQQEGSTILFAPSELLSPGIFELRKQDSLAAVLAFNDNRSESDLSYFSPQELEQMFPAKTELLNGNKLNANNIGSAANSGLQLWKLCIILALIFLAIEILLVRYFKVSKSQIAELENIN